MFGIFDFLKPKNEQMILIVGLGNQGQKYENNRHNVGFMAIDEVSTSLVAGSFKDKYFGKFLEANKVGQKIGLLKIGRYMNEGGKSVAAVAKFYKIPLDRIIVFHDELDLKPGQVRVKKGGGHAGHNGLKSMDASLGGKDYWRVRVGIGHPRDLDPSGNKEAAKDKVSSYVLSDFNKDDKKWLDYFLQDVGRYADLLVEGKFDEFGEKLK